MNLIREQCYENHHLRAHPQVTRTEDGTFSGIVVVGTNHEESIAARIVIGTGFPDYPSAYRAARSQALVLVRASPEFAEASLATLLQAQRA